jgi:hypothetical protein
MKKLLIILLSAFSLMVSAEEKKMISILEPKSDNAMVARMVTSTLTDEFARSQEWQPVEHGGKYILTTEINSIFGSYFINCHIIDVESAAILTTAIQETEASPQKILEACKSIATQLLKPSEEQ